MLSLREGGARLSGRGGEPEDSSRCASPSTSPAYRSREPGDVTGPTVDGGAEGGRSGGGEVRSGGDSGQKRSQGIPQPGSWFLEDGS